MPMATIWPSASPYSGGVQLCCSSPGGPSCSGRRSEGVVNLPVVSSGQYCDVSRTVRHDCHYILVEAESSEGRQLPKTL
jgi:hypothetical protein